MEFTYCKSNPTPVYDVLHELFTMYIAITNTPYYFRNNFLIQIRYMGFIADLIIIRY